MTYNYDRHTAYDRSVLHIDRLMLESEPERALFEEVGRAASLVVELKALTKKMGYPEASDLGKAARLLQSAMHSLGQKI
jgi:hypothetical protein